MNQILKATLTVLTILIPSAQAWGAQITGPAEFASIYINRIKATDPLNAASIEAATKSLLKRVGQKYSRTDFTIINNICESTAHFNTCFRSFQTNSQSALKALLAAPSSQASNDTEAGFSIANPSVYNIHDKIPVAAPAQEGSDDLDETGAGY
jgi:hypothetical protein